MNINKPLVISILAKSKEHILPLYLNGLLSQSALGYNTIFYIRTNDNKDNTSNILEDWYHKWKSKWKIVFDNSSVDQSLITQENHDWDYKRFKILGDIRQKSIDFAISEKADYFIADADNIILPKTIECIRSLNLPVVAPLLHNVDETSMYGNYHSTIDENGYFRSDDKYIPIYYRVYKGVIDVPVVHCTYFIKNEILPFVSYDDKSARYEYVIFSDTLRKNNIPQYIDNREVYGYISFSTNKEEFELDMNRNDRLRNAEEYITKAIPFKL